MDQDGTSLVHVKTRPHPGDPAPRWPIRLLWWPQIRYCSNYQQRQSNSLWFKTLRVFNNNVGSSRQAIAKIFWKLKSVPKSHGPSCVLPSLLFQLPFLGWLPRNPKRVDVALTVTSLQRTKTGREQQKLSFSVFFFQNRSTHGKCLVGTHYTYWAKMTLQPWITHRIKRFKSDVIHFNPWRAICWWAYSCTSGPASLLMPLLPASAPPRTNWWCYGHTLPCS